MGLRFIIKTVRNIQVVYLTGVAKGGQETLPPTPQILSISNHFLLVSQGGVSNKIRLHA